MNKLSEILQVVMSRKGNALFYTPPYYDDSKSYLFKGNFDSFIINANTDLNKFFKQIDKEISSGKNYYAALNYELGYCFEEKLKHFLKGCNNTLGYFRFFEADNVKEIKSSSIEFDLFTQQGKKFISDFRIKTDKEIFSKNIDKIKKYIETGYTYQVNYTTKASYKLVSQIEELISQLIFNQSASYIALINEGDKIVISISPELFFKIEDNKIESRPMKGTIRRGLSLIDDKLQLEKLKNSKKDHAENIMIVDLIRNDLGRVCEYDTVKTTSRLNTEKYETVYQLTSTIEGKLKTESIYKILKNIFPCGSITGAPKIKTMEIIKELEYSERGIYTGAIGFNNGQKTIFNVPIRTLEIDKNNNTGHIGIGSGIVWDSNPDDEYEECKSKAEFLTNPPPYFELIETMLYEDRQIFLWDYHINRLRDASEYFLFTFDENLIRAQLDAEINKIDIKDTFKIRLLLDKWGKLKITSSKYHKPILSRVKLSDEIIDVTNKFQYYKTTNRAHYNYAANEAKKMKLLDFIFYNERDEIAEGAITNIFIKKRDKYITPPINAGVLNGCYRQYLLDKNYAEEDYIYKEELLRSNSIFVGNSLMKMIQVTI
jgi:para-aminobenzoate synthetase/4-amino-4-deoxychorismate lyase